MSKKIAVLTSGGDAPGMNAVVRAVVRAGISAGLEVFGIRKGYNGLLTGDIVPMNLRSVTDVIHRGGTILYTARSPKFNSPEGVKQAADKCREMGIDGVVVVGGDGSFRGARDLTGAGIPCIAIPGTIDNDIASSEYTVGYDTAMKTAMEMVDRLSDTSASHNRCSVVEVMGRRCGDIALNTGIAVGATAILVPEVPFDFEKDVIERIRRTQSTGRQHFIIVVAEGCSSIAGNDVNDMAKRIEKETGVETRATVLGHVQRGGRPTLRDRVVASQMGCHAVDLLLEGKSNRVVVMQKGQITDYDITEALEMPRTFDYKLYNDAMRISI